MAEYAEPLMSELLQYRFPVGDAAPATGLGGHAVGTLLLAAFGGGFTWGAALLE